MNESLKKFLSVTDVGSTDLSKDKVIELNALKATVAESIKKYGECHLTFICTHNSRRSQISQALCELMAFHYDLEEVRAYSGGTEATAFYPSGLEALEEIGLEFSQMSEGANPVYQLRINEELKGRYFSKIYTHENNAKDYIAVMTCSHAEENCPAPLNAKHKMSLKYTDPKIFDGSDREKQAYVDKVHEIGRHLHWLFKNLSDELKLSKLG